MFYTKISYSVSKNAGKKDVDFRRTGTLNTQREVKSTRKTLVFGLNYCLIPPTQICKQKKRELAFTLLRSEVLVLILGALMSAIFEAVGLLNSFCEFSGKQK